MKALCVSTNYIMPGECEVEPGKVYDIVGDIPDWNNKKILIQIKHKSGHIKSYPIVCFISIEDYRNYILHSIGI